MYEEQKNSHNNNNNNNLSINLNNSLNNSSGNSTEDDNNNRNNTNSVGKNVDENDSGSPRASSCIELSEIRKLDSLLNQCESISCDNLLLYDDIYNYDLCKNYKRKYVSTTAINKVPPKNSIKRRTHKKLLGIRENDKKIIKFIDERKQLEKIDSQNDGEFCEKNEIATNTTQSCSNLPKILCDKVVQTSSLDLCGSKKAALPNHMTKPKVAIKSSLKKPSKEKSFTIKSNKKTNKRKQCTCRDFVCETSLTIPSQHAQLSSTSLSSSATNPKSVLSAPKCAKKLFTTPGSSSEKPGLSSGALSNRSFNKFGRLTKQKNTIVDDTDVNENRSDADEKNFCETNRVININEKSIEIIPISSSPVSPPMSPRYHSNGGTNPSTGHDNKSESETQSQKLKRSKFSPSFISRKLTSRLNSEEEAGGAKESLLGRNKSVEKKLPEPVETVCRLIYFIYV